MILIVCVDDHNGMMFNHRRQSQDRVLRADVLELTVGKVLWMNAYSRKQFTESGADEIRVDEAFLDAAGDGEFCRRDLCVPLEQGLSGGCVFSCGS